MAKLVTIAEAAKALGCSRANVYQLIKKRGIETERRPRSVPASYTRRIWVKHVDLEKLQEEQKIGEEGS